MNKMPTVYEFGDVYIDSQPQYRQWLIGGCSEYTVPAFWLSRGATSEQADEISQAWLELIERIAKNKMLNPIGQIITTISPMDDADWILMDGLFLLQSEYPELASVVPSSWLFGEYIDIPNMSTRTLIGGVIPEHPESATYGYGKEGGSTVVALTPNHMPIHSHGVGAGNSFINGTAGAGGIYTNTGANRGAFSTATANAGGNEPHSNMPPYLAVYYYIKAR